MCFVVGAVMLLRDRRLWVIPAMVLAVMAVHVLYFSSQRFAVPVQGQIYVCAAAMLAAAFRRVRAAGIAAALTVAVAGLWTIAAQALWLPGSYRAEAESLEGLVARSVADPVAGNGRARFASAAGGARPIAYIMSESFPRGAFAVRVRARTATCVDGAAPALVVSVRGETGSRFTSTFTVADLCRGPGYVTLASTSLLRDDEIIDLSVNSTGGVDIWVDQLQVLFG